MEDDKAFQKLSGDFSGVLVGAETSLFEVLAQITMLNVFHRDEDDIWILVPAKELNEEILALVLLVVSINI